MFPDLSQPEPLLHLSIPAEKHEQARPVFGYVVYSYIFIEDGGILNLAVRVMQASSSLLICLMLPCRSEC